MRFVYNQEPYATFSVTPACVFTWKIKCLHVENCWIAPRASKVVYYTTHQSQFWTLLPKDPLLRCRMESCWHPGTACCGRLLCHSTYVSRGHLSTVWLRASLRLRCDKCQRWWCPHPLLWSTSYSIQQHCSLYHNCPRKTNTSHRYIIRWRSGCAFYSADLWIYVAKLHHLYDVSDQLVDM